MHERPADKRGKKLRVMSKGIGAALEKIDRDNRQAAEVILADPERYAGIQATWARAWMEKHSQKPAQEDVANNS